MIHAFRPSVQSPLIRRRVNTFPKWRFLNFRHGLENFHHVSGFKPGTKCHFHFLSFFFFGCLFRMILLETEKALSESNLKAAAFHQPRKLDQGSTNTLVRLPGVLLANRAFSSLQIPFPEFPFSQHFEDCKKKQQGPPSSQRDSNLSLLPCLYYSAVEVSLCPSARGWEMRGWW